MKVYKEKGNDEIVPLSKSNLFPFSNFEILDDYEYWIVPVFYKRSVGYVIYVRQYNIDGCPIWVYCFGGYKPVFIETNYLEYGQIEQTEQIRMVECEEQATEIALKFINELHSKYTKNESKP